MRNDNVIMLKYPDNFCYAIIYLKSFADII